MSKDRTRIMHELRMELQIKTINYILNSIRAKMLIELSKSAIEKSPNIIPESVQKIIIDDVAKFANLTPDKVKELKLKPLTIYVLFGLFYTLLDIDRAIMKAYDNNINLNNLLVKDVIDNNLLYEKIDIESLSLQNLLNNISNEPFTIEKYLNFENVDKKFVDVINIERLYLEIDMIFLYGNLEAVLTDFLRILFKAQPRTLCSEKPLTYEEIIKLGNYDDIIKKMMSEYIMDFGRLAIPKKLEKLENYGIKSILSSIDIDFFEYVVKIRHLLVHNAGLADSDYENKYGKNVIKEGEFIPIDIELVEKTTTEFQKIVEIIRSTLEEKYLK